MQLAKFNQNKKAWQKRGEMTKCRFNEKWKNKFAGKKHFSLFVLSLNSPCFVLLLAFLGSLPPATAAISEAACLMAEVGAALFLGGVSLAKSGVSLVEWPSNPNSEMLVASPPSSPAPEPLAPPSVVEKEAGNQEKHARKTQVERRRES